MSSPLQNPAISSGEMFKNALSEGERRQAAGKKFLELESEEGFGIHLSEIVLDTNCSLPVRELAFKTLKKYVETHWCSTDKDFIAPEISYTNKTKIKELLLTGLPEPNGKVREGVAEILSSIVPWDWPDNWPELFEKLLDCLNGENKFAVYSGMQILFKLIDEVDETHMENVGSVILREMNRMFGDEDQYSVEIRSQAIKIFTDIVSEISAREQPDLITRYLQSEILVFCEKLISSWTSKNVLKTNNKLRIAMLEAIIILMEHLPEFLVNFLPNILPLIWKTVINSAEIYHSNAVFRFKRSNQGIIQVVQISNNFENLVMELLEFIGHLMSGKYCYKLNIPDYNLLDYEWFQLQDSFVTPRALECLISFMDITALQIQTWNSNINEFVEKEELKMYTSDGIRRGVEDLLIEFLDSPERAVVVGLISAIMEHLKSERVVRANGKFEEIQKRWKSHEAFLLAFCIMKEIIISRINAGSLQFDVADFLENIVLADIVNPGSHPLLIGRCLCLGGLCADQMPQELVSRFLKATMRCLQGNQPGCVKICAAKAVYLFYRRENFDEENKAYENILSTHVPPFFLGLHDLAKDFMSPEVLTLVLKSIAFLAPFNKTFTASVARKIYSLAVAALFEFRIENSDFCPWLNIFKELTLNPECIKLLQTRLVPRLVDTMSVNLPVKRNDDDIFLNIVLCLIKNSPQPLSNLLIESLFPVSCQCIANTTNWWTSDRGIEVLQTYLKAAGQEVVEYNDHNGKTGPEYILQAIVHCLNHTSGISRIENASNVVILLIKGTGGRLKENIDELLKAFHGMLHHEYVRTRARQMILMVFAHLLNTQPNNVLNFLSNAPPVGPQSALAFVISKGLCREYKTFDIEDRKTIKLALCNVLEHGATEQFAGLLGITF